MAGVSNLFGMKTNFFKKIIAGCKMFSMLPPPPSRAALMGTVARHCTRLVPLQDACAGLPMHEGDRRHLLIKSLLYLCLSSLDHRPLCELTWAACGLWSWVAHHWTKVCDMDFHIFHSHDLIWNLSFIINNFLYVKYTWDKTSLWRKHINYSYPIFLLWVNK